MSGLSDKIVRSLTLDVRSHAKKYVFSMFDIGTLHSVSPSSSHMNANPTSARAVFECTLSGRLSSPKAHSLRSSCDKFL